MPEKVIVCPFAMLKHNGSDFIVRGKRSLCMKPIAKVDSAKPGLAFPDFSDQVDVQKVVDSYAEDTGLAYALRQINSGRLMPSQLADKGTGGVDLSNLADNVNDAHRAALATADSAKKVSDNLDISRLDPRDIEAVVSKAIGDKIAALKAAQAVSKGEEK